MLDKIFKLCENNTEAINCLMNLDSNSLEQFILAYSQYSDSFDACKQFLFYFDIDNKQSNCYQEFYEKLKLYFSLDKKIIEIGDGWFPTINHLIDYEQRKIGKGSITCYDQEHKILGDGNIVFKNENIDITTNISEYDYIYSVNCCDEVELVISLAKNNNLEFIISTCTCPRKVPQDFLKVMDAIEEYKYKALYQQLLEEMNFFKVMVSKYDFEKFRTEKSINNKLYTLYLREKYQKDDSIFSYNIDLTDPAPILIKKKNR